MTSRSRSGSCGCTTPAGSSISTHFSTAPVGGRRGPSPPRRWPASEPRFATCASRPGGPAYSLDGRGLGGEEFQRPPPGVQPKPRHDRHATATSWPYDRAVAYDADLADRIRELIGPTRGVTEQKMFGGLAFLIGGNM